MGEPQMRQHGRHAAKRKMLVEEELAWSQWKARDKYLRENYPVWFQPASYEAAIAVYGPRP